MNQEVWVVFKGQIHVEGSDVPEYLANIEQVVEVVKAIKISKSYVKLVESPFYHPNVSYGDIIKVKSSEKLDDKVAIIEFSGVVDETEDLLFEEGLGTNDIGLNGDHFKEMMSIDKQAKPVINDKHDQGLVYEPVQLMSHGTYKINVAHEAESAKDLNNLKDYFETHDAVFRPSCNKKFGSVGFSTETQFEKAVECLEGAPGIVGCFIAFSPKEFPNINFSEDLIPKKEKGEE